MVDCRQGINEVVRCRVLRDNLDLHGMCACVLNWLDAAAFEVLLELLLGVAGVKDEREDDNE